MKVGMDGVLLGAWADASGSKRILDIGTGTGLIALMLAQKNSSGGISGSGFKCTAIGMERPDQNRIILISGICTAN